MFIPSDICKNKGSFPSHFSGIPFHNFQTRTYIRCKIDLIDHQQIWPCDARTAFSRDLISLSHINNKNSCIYKLRAECCGKIISTTFNKKDLDIRKTLHHLIHSFKVHRSILADSGMRASTGLHTNDPLYRKHTVFCKELCIFLGINIICDNTNAVITCHLSW